MEIPVRLGTVPYTGGNGGQGGAGGNGGGVFNSNYLLINESTVTSNRSGNGGTGGNGGQGSDDGDITFPSLGIRSFR